MNDTPRILVVDDEQSICLVLKLNLQLSGYEVDTATSAEQALKLPLERYDLLLLDVMLERMDGYELARQIRQHDQWRNIPIIFCTARDTEEDVLTGFSTGADDYIKKPFSMQELQARVQSVLRRSGVLRNQGEITCGGLKLMPASGICTLDGEAVTLTRKEFDLLSYLVRHRGQVFSRAQLLDAVWERDVYVIDRTIDVNINRLRKKLGKYGRHIITRQGFGYGYETDD